MPVKTVKVDKRKLITQTKPKLCKLVKNLALYGMKPEKIHDFVQDCIEAAL